MTLLRVENLQLSINSTQVLRNINCTLESGKILGIVGESGSGKSMTAYSIMRLLPRGSVASGSITLDGSELGALTEAQMCGIRGNDIGMIFQEPMTALNPVQTIGDQVAETVRIHRRVSRVQARNIAAETLERVELPNSEFPLTRYPHELSGGQRQRVVIAMAIALQPRLLIADEPTTALDVTTQARILSLLKRLVCEDNMALILISHDLAVVAQTTDSMVIMRHGDVVDSGPAKNVFNELKHPYTRQLFEASGHVPIRSSLASRQEILLQVQGVSRDYQTARKTFFSKPGVFRALDRVSFDLYRGEKLGLVGESGCGKSTLTRAILGLDACQEGSITLAGESIKAGQLMPRPVLRKMQVVFQDPYGSFNPRHKVGRLVSEPFYILDHPPRGKARRSAVAEVLESVGLQADDADKYIHEFSGGQRQRIAIARALITKPQLIILDEAVSALDVSIRATILDLLAELSADHDLAYLFISHDLTVVRAVTDRVLIMKDGGILEHGDTESVFAKPRHRYTQELIAAAPSLSCL
ncbi:microcin ABC transporter ATP-binding protein [Chromatiales bacterium (ex Bugula neritina AB1)]|nr:microcin ABC transporter ATP-binding protein [Chromatiales bacterium (ex Bugula neritina AB1)]